MFNHRERMARKTLRSLGVAQSWRTRFGPYIFLLGALGIASIFVIHDAVLPCGPELKGFAIPFVTTAALIVAYNQWRHLRNEVSITGSIERLDIVNSYFKGRENLGTVTYFFGDQATWDDGIQDQHAWQQKMYVFMELDNLQYALEKYRLGYSSAYQAMRIVDVFAARCKSEKFLATAHQLVRDDYGSYTGETRRAVSRLKSGQRFNDILNAS